MEGNEETVTDKTKYLLNGIVKEIQLNLSQLKDNITSLDLNDRNLMKFDENVEFPPSLIHINLCCNKLTEVPSIVLNLENLKSLDLSFNNIVYFDDVPTFCHNIEQLNLSNNKLKGPPYWVWSEKPRNLLKLDVSGNQNICQSFVDGYLEELLTNSILVNEIDIHNCSIRNKHLAFVSTFCKARIINLGTLEYCISASNHTEDLPCVGLDQCCDIERLNLANTHLYNVNPNIDMYKNLKEINLFDNSVHSLPNEFCNLVNLQICVLSYNKLLYLPEGMHKLTQLICLRLDNNELCMIPDCVYTLLSLKTLDLYNNNLYDEPDKVEHLEELDLAQNYFTEPGDDEYLARKQMLRLSYIDRIDGRKEEAVVETESDRTSQASDNELYALMTNEEDLEKSPKVVASRSSTPEDWDSDEHWIPRYYSRATPPCTPWLQFVKRKMAEGNFCPMDAHTVSITERVKFEKMTNPQEPYESDGQFDDFTDDDS